MNWALICPTMGYCSAPVAKATRRNLSLSHKDPKGSLPLNWGIYVCPLLSPKGDIRLEIKASRLVVNEEKHQYKGPEKLAQSSVIQRFTRNLKILNKRAKPSVASAFLRASLNGWSTARRMRTLNGTNGRDACAFRCGAAVDSIEHYAFCPTVSAFAREIQLSTRWSGIYRFFALESNIVKHGRFLHALMMTLITVQDGHDVLKLCSAAFIHGGAC